MWKRRLTLLMFLLLVVSGFQIYAQTDDDGLPPIVFMTATQVLTWTEAEGLTFIVDLPTPTYELGGLINRPGIIWRDAVVSPNLQYIAYAVITPEWQALIGRDDVHAGDNFAENIYIIDIGARQTKPVVLQDTAEARSQVTRWSLNWSTDSQTLFWMENADEGDLISYDLATNTFDLIIDNAAPFYSSVTPYTTDRIMLSDLSIVPNEGIEYSLYATDGTLISHVGVLDSTENYAYTYVITDEDDLYLATNVMRVNIETGEISDMPTGHLVEMAADAPTTSLRLLPSELIDGICISEVTTAEGDTLTTIPINRSYHFSPDGSAIFYEDEGSGFYFILQQDQGSLNRIELPPLPDFPYVIAWGAKTTTLESGGEGFSGRFSCPAGG